MRVAIGFVWGCQLQVEREDLDIDFLDFMGLLNGVFLANGRQSVTDIFW